MSEGANSRSWWLFGGAALGIGALLIIALAREPVVLDPNTPEGTVQNYLQAISDGDYAGAFNLIDPDLTEGCRATDLATSAPRNPFSATLGETETTGNTAFVTVTIRQGASPGPFDPAIGGYPEFFDLENKTGVWLISGRPWPYFEWMCETP